MKMPEPPPNAGLYRCLVVDPPWDQGKTGRRKVRPNQGTDLDYPTLTLNEIADIPIGDWACDGAFLMLWATNSKSRSSGKPILVQAFDLMLRWGFTYYTTLTWDKGTGPCPFGPFQITTEHCLIGYRGRFAIPRDVMGKMKTLIREVPKAHSQKPTVFYENVAKFFDGPRVDVFARQVHAGFDAWGNEAPAT